MKKYLLTALLGVFGLCTAFASAETFTVSGESYSPSSIIIDEDYTLSSSSISNYNCSNEYGCLLRISNSDIECSVVFYGGNFTISTRYDDGSCLFSPGTYTVSSEDNPFSSISIDIPVASSDSDSSGTLLPNGTEDLRGIINGLESTMAEFIPYIAYIGLGIIVACLGFVAIRRLVNWVRAKIFDNF